MGAAQTPVNPQGGGSIASLMQGYAGNNTADLLGNMAAGLIQASGPSTTPRSFVDILASGIGAGVQGQAGSEDKALKRALVASQVATAQQKIKQQDAWAKLLAPTQATANAPQLSTASVALDPTNPGGAPNPNNIGNVRPNGQSVGFQQPPSFEDGVNLAINNAKAYPAAFNGGQPMTLLQIGQKWAPKGDGANDPQQWALNVSKVSGLPPDQPLDLNNPQTAAAFARGVHGAEWGPQAVRPPEAYMLAGGPPQAPQQPLPQGGTALPAGMPGQAVPQAAQPSSQPQTIQDVLGKVPPAVKQLLGAMPIEQGVPVLMKYAEPNHQIAMDTRTGQVIFADKNDIGRVPYLVPVDAAKLQVEQQKLNLDKQRTEGTLRNQDVILDPGGQPIINKPLIEAKKDISAAQGTDVSGHADKAMIDQAIKEHGDMQNNALQARTGIAQTQRLGSLLDQINTGKFTSTTQDVKQIAKGLGFNLEAMGVKDDTAPAQAAQALSSQLALSLRNPSQGAGMPGAMSDADRNFLAKMVPSLETTPEGRKLMVDYSQKMYQRSLDTAKIANDWLRSGKIKTDPAGMYAEIQKYADEHPLFTDKDVPNGGMSPVPAPPTGFNMPGGNRSMPAPPAGFRPL